MILLLPLLAILLSPFLWMVFCRPRYLSQAEGAGEGSISIIIPARDEEENIAKLLKSIQQQSVTVHEVIVVNDHSSDNTVAVAEKYGARVIHAEELPEGWRGKPWACQSGAQAASSEWLLFLDADIEFNYDAVRFLQKLTDSEDVAYSVCPRHSIRQPYEELSSFFNLIMALGVNAFGAAKIIARGEALFGQCLFIKANDFGQVGGHAEVKGKVLENLHLAEKLDAIGVQRRCYLGGDMISMRMFPEGISQLWSSWQKGFVSGAGKVDGRVLLYSSLWLSGAMFCLGSLALLFISSSPAYLTVVALAYFIYALQCIWAFRAIGNFSIINGVLFPLGLVFYQTLFFYSLVMKKRGKTTLWKGREVC